MSSPIVTVIIATWNWSSVLPYSIGSALRQTLSDIEVLVVGDCCTDDSENVVAAIADPRLRWINLTSNVGHQSGPNNEGLRQARGEYIAYLGHDDLWLPHHLAVLVAALKCGADLTYSAVRSVLPDDSKAVHLAVPVPYTVGLSIPPTSVVHRKSLIAQVGDWKDYRSIDLDPEADLWLRMHQAGARIQFVSRLTAIKLPASARRDVYKLKPCHEQEKWFKRIETEPDLEAVELTAMLLDAQTASIRKSMARPYRLLIKDLIQETTDRIKIRMIELRSGMKHSGNMIEYRQKFKGLDRDPK